MRRRPAAFLPTRLCSTPFGIGEVFTDGNKANQTGGDACSTPFGIGEVFTREAERPRVLLRVLNAFRHRRGLHWTETDGSGSYAECSTPFGIGEVFTTNDDLAPDMILVCSTPFGIGEVFTAPPLPIVALDAGAQRLSASERSSPGSRG